MQEEEKSAPVGIHHYLGWIILAVLLIPFIGFSLVLHIKENREIALSAEKWKVNWPQLKLGMSKEEVLALVGAPNSTTDVDTKADDITTDPPDPAIEKDVREKLGPIVSYSIWSYYDHIVIHLRRGESFVEAEGDGAIQFKQLENDTGAPKLHGHALKFNQAGQIIEISSQ